MDPDTRIASERVGRLAGRQRRIEPEIAAKEILDILIELDGDLITYRDLAELTDLSRSNVQLGVNYLRDEVLGVEGVSFVSEAARGGGIALTRDPNRAMAYVLYRARIARTQQQRLIAGTISPMTQYAQSTAMKAEVEAIQRNQARILEDLEAMIQRMEAAGVTPADRRKPDVQSRRSS